MPGTVLSSVHDYHGLILIVHAGLNYYQLFTNEAADIQKGEVRT